MAVEVAVAVATIAGEALLSASFEALLGKLGSPESLKFARQEKIDAELEKWKIILEDIFQVLEDAEDKQSTIPSVKTWLNDLRDLAYDVDDILDEINTEALRRKVTKESKANTSKVRKFIPTCCFALNPKPLMFNVEMGSKIQDITSRLQDIESRKNPLRLTGDARRSSQSFSDSTSLLESLPVGRDEDKAAILKLMNDSQVSVIHIQGMGGVGKTTLAQLVYNETQVKFDLHAWVCVSDNFDIPSITKTVLQQVAPEENCVDKDLNSLQVKLKEKLAGKKFLIVLDDVWNEEYGNWAELRKPFQTGARESKTIVTTRNISISSIMDSNPAATPVHTLKVLLDDECVSILAQHALGEENFNGHPNLKAVGEEIAKKCKGLPLAAKAIGGVLRKRQQDKWVDILESSIWDEASTTILPALRLSYRYLSSPLKQCFAYCAIFPKDYEFDRDELVLLWMAEGFLQRSQGNKKMETLGREYFDDLWSRSFFQRISENEMRFVMHDLIHDLAKFVSGEICFHLDDKTKSATSEKTRYSSFIRNRYEVSKKFEVYNKMKRLRTFAALSLRRQIGYWYISSKVLHDLSELRCLRVLSLCNYQISELSNSIGKLKHLRYLNLSSTSIKELPESIGDLYNLQVLLLRGCKNLTKLPQRIGNLIHLRHLDIYSTISLQEMPLEIGSLINLQKLSKFVVGKGGGLGLKDLKDLSHLQGELSIMGLDNVADVQDARFANLKGKHGLTGLSMDWGNNFNVNPRNEEDVMYAMDMSEPLDWGNNFNENLRNGEDEMHVMNMLEPHKNLKELTIVFFGGRKFSSWMGDPAFDKIVRLHIHGCEKITSLPSLGRLPSLKILHTKSMGGVKSVGLEFYGDTSHSVVPFSSLETLIFEDMREWEEWSSSTNIDECKFPRLRELRIVRCPKLSGKLPSHLSSLVKLSIRKCPILAISYVTLPSLCELKLEECNSRVLRSMADLTSLTILRLKRILEFTCFHEGLMQFLVALEDLAIEDCCEITTLGQGKTKIKNLAHLKSLHISKCPKLVSLVGGVPSSLKSLVIEDCEAIELLADSINNCILEYVSIDKCPSLKILTRGKFPTTTLKSLVIEDCEKIQSFSHLEPTEEFCTTLKELQVDNCTQLEESVLGRTLLHNTSLETISIWNWTKLKSLPDCLHSLTHLTSLSINDCPALESFPERGLFIPNLTGLFIRDCKSLKALPNGMQKLISLQKLDIWNCPNIVSIPEGGLPPNLTSLSLSNCENMKQPLSEWGLQRLTYLSISSDCDAFRDMVSFPDYEHDFTLPMTIIHLSIENFLNLKAISRGLQNLTSLQTLAISECPKLQSLPKETLPSTLGHLRIAGCPLLGHRCLKGKGEYWPFIAHIPCIEIDYVYQ